MAREIEGRKLKIKQDKKEIYLYLYNVYQMRVGMVEYLVGEKKKRESAMVSLRSDSFPRYVSRCLTNVGSAPTT